MAIKTELQLKIKTNIVVYFSFCIRRNLVQTTLIHETDSSIFITSTTAIILTSPTITMTSSAVTLTSSTMTATHVSKHTVTSKR